MNLQLSLFAPPPAAALHRGPAAPRTDYHDPFLAAHVDVLAAAGSRPITFDAVTWDHAGRGAVGMDVESFPNFFVVCFKRFSDGRKLAFERSERGDFEVADVLAILASNTIIMFNGPSYDLPMLGLALAGASPAQLKAASDKIIFKEVKPWQIEKEIGVRPPRCNYIDLMEPNPSVRQGLKMLHGRLHGRFMVDLPFPPETRLTPEQMNVVTLYCFNDIDATEGLYKALREPLELRAALGKTYGLDLRSKSDSQIGEAIVKRRVESTIGQKIERDVKAAPVFSYEVPTFIAFQDPALVDLVGRLRTAVFSVDAAGTITPPDFLKNLQVPLGKMKYAMGIGGLHSTEAHRALTSDDKSFLLDVDVASQYPSIIMKLGLYPPALGPAFLKIYGEIIKERLAAKDAGDKVRADGGRIMLNGVYGKLGSPYSSLYAPNLIIAITLTGQLAILMLIERAEASGIPVVSANTDGVVFRCPRRLELTLAGVIRGWEAETGFKVDRTPYRALYNASVNTYVAIKEDGKVKRKGYLADPWTEGDLRGQMSKNPQMTVCSEAVVRYLKDGVPLNDTILGAKDPRAFVTVIKVATGAKWRGHPLGRAVRYYWSTDGDPILYAESGRRVAKTEGARPLGELTNELPPDLDHLRYFNEAARLAADLAIPGF